MSSPDKELFAASSHSQFPLRTILITGATGAIGSQIVRALSERALSDSRFWQSSTRIVAHGFQNAEKAQVLQRETNCELRFADIGDEAQIERLFCGLENLFAVVHCAGIARDDLLVKQSRARWDETLRVNGDGTFLVVRESLRKLTSGGRLVIVASRVGEIGGIGQSAYAATKAAQIALMKSAARESSTRKLCVNAICPGVVDSPMTQTLSEARQAELASQSLFGETGSARAVAGTVQWLLSDFADEVSGQVIHCDNRL